MRVLEREIARSRLALAPFATDLRRARKAGYPNPDGVFNPTNTLVSPFNAG